MDTSYLLMFISLLDDTTVSAMNEMITSATILKTNASLMIKGFLRLVTPPPKPIKPLFMKKLYFSPEVFFVAILTPEVSYYYPKVRLIYA